MKLIIQLFLFTTISLSAVSQNITQWRGNNRDGIYNETGLLKKWPDGGPKLLWHFDELGDGFASAAVTNNMIVTAGMFGEKGFVVALDKAGKLIWKTEYATEWTESYNGSRSTPLLYEGNIYVMSALGKLICLSLQSGKVNWSIDLIEKFGLQNIKWGVTENLLVADNKLFVTIGDVINNIIALNPTNGNLIWTSKGNGEQSAYCSPVLINTANSKIFVTNTQKSIIGIDASNGNMLWTHPQINYWGIHPNTPLYSNGYIYCVSGYGTGGVQLKLSSDGTSVAEQWRDSSLDNRMGGVVLLNNRLYGTGDKSRKFICLDWLTGKVLYSTKQFTAGNIISAEGLLYVYAESGTIALVEPKNEAFNVISTFKVPFGSNQHWAHTVISDGVMYIRHGNSLMAFDIKERL